MAEEHDQSSKTEEATPRKLEEARRRGEVAKSMDVASWASLAGVTGALAIAGGWMARDLVQRLIPFVDHPEAFDLHGIGAMQVLRDGVMASVPILAIVLGAGAVSGIAGNVVQHGFLWSGERMKPDLNKLSPAAGLQRLYGAEGLIQFVKSIVKVLVTCAVAWWAMRPHAQEIQNLAEMDPAAILPFCTGVLKSLTFAVVAVLGVGAAIDWIWQRQRFMARMRMSREELKEDVRQSEGDPHVRGRLRALRAERARRRMIQAVPKATVVVMNPTHYAVALRYVQGETPAPVCVAKGVDATALRIRAVAEEHDVPVIEDPPLARALFGAVEVDQSIPTQHYEAVAKIIGFVLNGARRRRA